MYIALISLHALVMVVFHFLYCFEDDWTSESSVYASQSSVYSLISHSPASVVFSVIKLTQAFISL